jgi:multiple sugar transport system substrate-binding protein
VAATTVAKRHLPEKAVAMDGAVLAPREEAMRFRLGAAVFAASMMLASASMAAEKTSLNIWLFADWTTGTQGDELKRQIAAFEQANPDIAVQINPKQSTEIIAGLIANGKSPGVDVVATQLRASSLVQAHVLTDLTPYWKASTSSFRDQFTKSFVDVLTKGGQLLGIPYTTTASVVYRNLNVLKSAGIDPADQPKDWGAWLAQMKKVKDSGNFAVANQLVEWFQVLNYYGGIPGATFELQDGKSTLDKDKLAKALTFMKQTQPFAAPVDSLQQGELDLFTTGKLAFLISGAWTYPSLKAAEPQGLKFDSIAVPGETAEKHGGVYDGEFFAIPVGSEHKDAAWKLVQYLADAPQAAAFSVVAGRFIANDVALQNPAVKGSAFIQQQAVVIKQTINDAPFLEAVPADAPNAFAQGASDLKQGNSTPEKAAATIVDDYNEALQ